MLQGHFIQSTLGRVFVTQFGEKLTDTTILCMPSVGEEMNLCRAVVAKQAQAFARNDTACVVVDYFGTGDSEGLFEHASVELWLEDVVAVGRWLISQGVTNIILWGVRLGALIALANQQKLHQLLPIKKQIMWKPIIRGRQFTEQFLRLKLVNSLLANESEKKDWRQEILDGNNTEIAGYVLTKQTLQSIDNLDINIENKPLSETVWFDLASMQSPPYLKKLISAWQNEKLTVICHQCPAFWVSPEVFSLPELESLGVNCLADVAV